MAGLGGLSGRRRDAPHKPLELVPGAVEDARVALAAHPESLKRFERVAELVDGFESPFGLELLATVHWVAREGVISEEDVIAKTYEWGDASGSSPGTRSCSRDESSPGAAGSRAQVPDEAAMELQWPSSVAAAARRLRSSTIQASRGARRPSFSSSSAIFSASPQ
jgi:hypothetical protein